MNTWFDCGISVNCMGSRFNETKRVWPGEAGPDTNIQSKISAQNKRAAFSRRPH